MEKLTLAGQEIEVYELPYRLNKDWCERAEPPAQALRAVEERTIQGLPLPELYKLYVETLQGHMDTVFTLVLERLPADQRTIAEEGATQTELLAAFVKLLREANSTGFFLGLVVAASRTGADELPTGTNLPEVNGESGPTS
jgi:hypothetical protein